MALSRATRHVPLGGILGETGGSAEVVDLRERCAGTPAVSRRDAHATFAAAVADNDDRLRALAYHLLGTREAMDDVLQEVYLKAYRHLSTFRGDSSLATWLHRITYTTCIDRLRREKRTEPATAERLENALPGAPGADDAFALRDELHRALATLMPERRAAVLLVLRDGHTYAEAAAVLGVPTGTVASTVALGRKQLIRELSLDAEGGERR